MPLDVCDAIASGDARCAGERVERGIGDATSATFDSTIGEPVMGCAMPGGRPPSASSGTARTRAYGLSAARTSTCVGVSAAPAADATLTNTGGRGDAVTPDGDGLDADAESVTDAAVGMSAAGPVAAPTWPSRIGVWKRSAGTESTRDAESSSHSALAALAMEPDFTRGTDGRVGVGMPLRDSRDGVLTSSGGGALLGTGDGFSTRPARYGPPYVGVGVGLLASGDHRMSSTDVVLTDSTESMDCVRGRGAAAADMIEIGDESMGYCRCDGDGDGCDAGCTGGPSAPSRRLVLDGVAVGDGDGVVFFFQRGN